MTSPLPGPMPVGTAERGGGEWWSARAPLATLAIYSFAFGTVMRSRIPSGDADGAPFALVLFVGLVLFQVFAETVSAAPSLVRNNATYVKQIVFPLEILPVVSLVAALFNAAVGTVVLLAFSMVFVGLPPLGALWLPLMFVPAAMFALGAAWFLAGAGVFVRDLAQTVGIVCTALLFTSTTFFALDAVPDRMKPLVMLNPTTTLVDAARSALFAGSPPAWGPLVLCLAAALVSMLAGYLFFSRVRPGFADVA
ncbi:MAG: ABC transporter permease [Phycisphaerales bacterium]